MSGSGSPAPRAGRREWVGLAVIALPCIMYAMDFTVLDLAVPRLSAELRPSSAQLLWIVDVYGFVLASLLIPMGALGDRIGRRRLLLIGAAGFVAASVFAAFARSAVMLIAARAALGVAGATLAPSTLSLIRNMFLDEQQRTRAISIWITSYSVGGVIGPLLGGVLLEHFWWGSVFLMGVPVMLLLLVAGPALLPEFRDPNAARPDFLSSVMSLSAVLLVIYGMKRIALADSGIAPILAATLGVAIGVLLVRRQRSIANPIVDLQLFRSATFSAALVAYAIATLVIVGTYLFVVQYLQLVKGLSPLEAGMATLPMFAGLICGALVTPALTRRTSRSNVIVCGFLASAVGFGLLAITHPDSSVAVILIGTAIYAFALSPVTTISTDLMVGSASPERAGAASALSESGSELGAALGIALLGTVGSAVYQYAMAVHLAVTSIPSDLGDAARNTLGGALMSAERLPGSVGLGLIAAAREAFSRSLNVVAIVSGVTVLATSLGVYVVLCRGTRSDATTATARLPELVAEHT